ncbi:SMP-30/gluconolactonase/LRE family protein [Primorskyibacter aestuariivivens]|nr:SMP-30/gluconolactonase/LRE family protein [Primorskyibacter aestuariivivens]MDA7430971.1 SMP-30/gluconolactonase/LRE family protein [Primorskyibacter aestuariivivens]
MTATRYDARSCELGEGPLWHPERKQLFWFDILGNKLLSRRNGTELEWQFDEHVSAAGWVDRDTLLIASETGLFRFVLDSGSRELIHPLEADKPQTRSNDGRADRQGGFWIGTMGKRAERHAGAIYRYFRGEVRKLFDGITIPNAICFAPDGRTAYFCDTPKAQIMRQPLDSSGWPLGSPEVFIDLREVGLNPDGAVCDAEGGIWNAQWGAGRVARYHPDGTFDRAVSVDGRHSSCPAFGGKDFTQLFVTTAREDLPDATPSDGCVYQATLSTAGLPEAQVMV